MEGQRVDFGLGSLQIEKYVQLALIKYDLLFLSNYEVVIAILKHDEK